jgi:prolyl-tRNA editing enzyme YbaK/EbsC (Cys-tRNA(Pro) deacylase)
MSAAVNARALLPDRDRTDIGFLVTKDLHGPAVAGAADAGRVVRVVPLVDGKSTAVALLARDRHLDLSALNREFGRRYWADSPGADDPASLARRLGGTLPAQLRDGVEVFIDQSLVHHDTILFETGEAGVYCAMENEKFCDLFDGAWCGSFSRQGD